MPTSSLRYLAYVSTDEVDELGDVHLEGQVLLTDAVDGRIHIMAVHMVTHCQALVHAWGVQRSTTVLVHHGVYGYSCMASSIKNYYNIFVYYHSVYVL